MAISSLGAGSGIDLNSIVTSLMQVEQQPLLALQTKEATYQARISALGNLKSGLSSLLTASQFMVLNVGQNPNDKFASFKATLADTTIATATAASGAVVGNYNLEVTALAVSHRLTSPDSLDIPGAAAVTAGLAAGGMLKIELGTQSGLSGAYAFAADTARELNVTVAAGSTLEQMRDAINTAAADGRVSATIINGTNGKQLVLSSSQTGLSNVMKLSGVSGFDFDPSGAGSGVLSQDSLKGGQAATNAAYKLNGIAGTSSTNSVTGALDGVTLSLLKTTSGTPTTLTVTKDSTTQLVSALGSFIKAYNESAGVMKNLGYYDATTKKAGALQGNATLRSVQNETRNLLQTKAGGTSVYQTLSDIGVSIQKDGTLALNTTKLTAAIAADFSGVSTLVSTVGSSFKSNIDNVVGSTGSITNATDGINRLISDLDKRANALQSRLTTIESRYRKQFSALDTLVTSMNGTSAYLTQQLANLPGAYRSNNN